MKVRPGVVVSVSNPSPQEVETGGPWICRQLGLHIVRLSMGFAVLCSLFTGRNIVWEVLCDTLWWMPTQCLLGEVSRSILTNWEVFVAQENLNLAFTKALRWAHLIGGLRQANIIGTSAGRVVRDLESDQESPQRPRYGVQVLACDQKLLNMRCFFFSFSKGLSVIFGTNYYFAVLGMKPGSYTCILCKLSSAEPSLHLT
jgi:hypothetical protein